MRTENMAIVFESEEGRSIRNGTEDLAAVCFPCRNRKAGEHGVHHLTVRPGDNSWLSYFHGSQPIWMFDVPVEWTLPFDKWMVSYGELDRIKRQFRSACLAVESLAWELER